MVKNILGDHRYGLRRVSLVMGLRTQLGRGIVRPFLPARLPGVCLAGGEKYKNGVISSWTWAGTGQYWEIFVSSLGFHREARHVYSALQNIFVLTLLRRRSPGRFEL